LGVAEALPCILHILPQLCCDPTYPVSLLFRKFEWKATYGFWKGDELGLFEKSLPFPGLCGESLFLMSKRRIA
jgi:hypothetical protein